VLQLELWPRGTMSSRTASIAEACGEMGCNAQYVGCEMPKNWRCVV